VYRSRAILPAMAFISPQQVATGDGVLFISSMHAILTKFAKYVEALNTF